MNRLQLLLCKLAEEAAEISQIAMKCQQFGLHEICPDGDESNATRTHKELNDLLGIVQMLNDEFGFNFQPNQAQIASKRDKVNRYAVYSKSLGMLDD